MLADDRIKEIRIIREMGRKRTPEELCPLLARAINDLLSEREELLAVREAARMLAGELPDFALDYAREAWGNTNTSVVQHWRDKLRAALAGKGETNGEGL